MLSLKQFISKARGLKYIDYDGVYGFQCVDLIKQYLHDCFGLNPGAWGDAVDYWTNTNPAILKKFTKVNGSQVKPGDIVVKSPNHVGIATGSSNASSVEILEQNGHTGSGKKSPGNEIRFRYIPRSQVLGLLRPKTTTRAVYYVVRKGDTLWGIARAAHLTVKALLTMNKQIKNPDVIHPGDKIKEK